MTDDKKIRDIPSQIMAGPVASFFTPSELKSISLVSRDFKHTTQNSATYAKEKIKADLNKIHQIMNHAPLGRQERQIISQRLESILKNKKYLVESQLNSLKTTLTNYKLLLHSYSLFQLSIATAASTALSIFFFCDAHNMRTFGSVVESNLYGGAAGIAALCCLRAINTNHNVAKTKELITQMLSDIQRIQPQPPILPNDNPIQEEEEEEKENKHTRRNTDIDIEPLDDDNPEDDDDPEENDNEETRLLIRSK